MYILQLQISHYICAKKLCENWLRVDKSYCNENRVQFFLAHAVRKSIASQYRLGLQS